MRGEMNLPKNVLYVIEALEASGFSADVVGGAVRDFLLGTPSFDYDITTSATPEEVKRTFAGHRTLDTGIKHGTVTLMLDGVGYEITTYRTDGAYADGRHPDTVSFTRSLTEDLARRDFTVNAIAYNPRRGYTDPFSGIPDIERRIIRAVGEPERRFSEDALRIMRAVRFASKLGFAIEPETAEALRRLAPTLDKISRERIHVEWRKLLAGKDAYAVISEYREVISAAIPELSGLPLPPSYTFIDTEPEVRELLLFAMSDTPRESFSSAMHTLRCDNKTRVLGETVLSAISVPLPSTRPAVAEFLSRSSHEVLDVYLKLSELLGVISEADADKISEIATDGNLVYSVSQLAVSGNDLMHEGLRGREVGEKLEMLLHRVMLGECENTRVALLRSITTGKNK